MSLTFGVSSTATYGLLQEVSAASTAEVAEARDETGKVTYQKAYSKEAKGRVRYVLNGTSPAIGTTATVGGIAGLVTSVTETENNTAYKTGEAEVSIKDAATLTAYA